MTRSSPLSGRDRFGQFHLSAENQILTATFSGALNQELAKKYTDGLYSLVEHLQHQPWGFLCIAPDFEASTSATYAQLIAAYEYCAKRNCQLAVYCITSPLARSQVTNWMQQAGIVRNIDDIMFQCEDEARQVLSSYLDQLA